MKKAGIGITAGLVVLLRASSRVKSGESKAFGLPHLDFPHREAVGTQVHGDESRNPPVPPEA